MVNFYIFGKRVGAESVILSPLPTDCRYLHTCSSFLWTTTSSYFRDGSYRQPNFLTLYIYSQTRTFFFFFLPPFELISFLLSVLFFFLFFL